MMTLFEQQGGTYQRKIITPVFWWQKYLGFYETENGTKVKLIYKENPKGIFLYAAEVLD